MPFRRKSRPVVPVAAAPAPTITEVQLREDVRVLTRRVDALLAIVEPIVTRRISIGKQAQLAGCSRATFWRRRKRAQQAALFNRPAA